MYGTNLILFLFKLVSFSNPDMFYNYQIKFYFIIIIKSFDH